MFQWLTQRKRSFGYAFSGVWALFSTQPHALIHAVAACVVVAVGIYFGIDKVEWAILILTIGVVIALEAMNTAIEFLADAVHPDQHPLIGKAKDVAAGSVLIASIAAACIGMIIFYPYILQKII